MAERRFGTSAQRFAQGWNSVGARSNSLAGASVAIDDVWAYHNNPGALATIKSLTIGAYYETRFLTKELQTQSLAAAIPLKKGVISIGGQFYGYENYRNTRAGIGYSLQLADKIAAGIQSNIQQLKLGGNYGSSTNATVEAGILANVSEKWAIGASVMNLGRSRIGNLEDRYTSVLRLGVNYKPSSKVNFLAEIEKQVIHTISFKGAVEYIPTENFFIRIGAHTAATELAFGIGYKKSGFSIDLGSRYNQTLGWTPHFGLTYQVQKNEQK